MGFKLPPIGRVGMPNFLCWSQLEDGEREFSEAGLENVSAEALTLRFDIEKRADAVAMWNNMAVSFPTLHWVWDFLLKEGHAPEKVHTVCQVWFLVFFTVFIDIDAYTCSVLHAPGQVNALKTVVANCFADIIEQRGHSEEDMFGYLDGTAHVITGQKS